MRTRRPRDVRGAERMPRESLLRCVAAPDQGGRCDAAVRSFEVIKMLNDILVMGRLDIYVDEGKHETIALNYQTLDREVIDFNNRFKTGGFVGFSLFLTMIVLMAWGLA